MNMSDNPIGDFLKKKSNGASEYLAILEDMLNSGDYRYAEQTLADIYSFIEKNDHITDAQIQAVENIKQKPSNGRF